MKGGERVVASPAADLLATAEGRGEHDAPALQGRVLGVWSPRLVKDVVMSL